MHTAAAKERLRLAAELHQEAVMTVSTALDQMDRLHRSAAVHNPSLAPDLAAYFTSARGSMLGAASSILADAAPSPAAPARRRTLLPRRRSTTVLAHPMRCHTGTKEIHPDGSA